MDKYVKDYLPRLKELYPEVDIKDIRRMVEFGWRMFYYYNLRGCDTLYKSPKYKFWMYCGDMQKDSKKHYAYYKTRLRRKIRALYSKKKIKWDGFYYTFVTEEEYNKYLNPKNPNRKIFLLKDKICFKIQDEAEIFFTSQKYIVKFKYIIDMGYSFQKDLLRCKELELVVKKDNSTKFKDILISNNKYVAL